MNLIASILVFNLFVACGYVLMRQHERTASQVNKQRIRLAAKFVWVITVILNSFGVLSLI